ncbi:MAG: cytochrome c biogenesis protein [Planctomycetota bacterium]|jgi:cytochrome c-type biogenesis protein CcsB
MAKAEIILFWITIFTYAGSFCLHLFGFISAKLVFHTATGIIRWVSAHHPPVFGTYELNLTGTWFTVLIFLVFQKMRRMDSSIGLVVTPIVFLVLGHGLISRSEAVPMGPAYQSPWLVVHVIFAWLAFGCYVISTGAAILLLIRTKFLSWRPGIKIPGGEALDIAGYRFIAIGFINHAVMLVSGAIWAKKLWGHYWSWDALETWSLISFLFYAFYLHARSFLGWKMRRAAWLTVIGLIVVAISFWGVDWFAPSPHPGP